MDEDNSSLKSPPTNLTASNSDSGRKQRGSFVELLKGLTSTFSKRRASETKSGDVKSPNYKSSYYIYIVTLLYLCFCVLVFVVSSKHFLFFYNHFNK